MQNKLIREETTGINRVAMPYPVPQGWNDNKGYVKTKVTEDGAQVVVDETHLVKETRLATNIEILPGETFSKFITIDVPFVSGYVTATETLTATSWELEFAYRAGYYAQGFRSEEKKSSDATIGTQFPRLQELKRHNAPTRVFNYIVRNNTESTIQVTPVFLEWRL